jgi:hypothetical protein
MSKWFTPATACRFPWRCFDTFYHPDGLFNSPEELAQSGAQRTLIEGLSLCEWEFLALVALRVYSHFTSW